MAQSMWPNVLVEFADVCHINEFNPDFHLYMNVWGNCQINGHKKTEFFFLYNNVEIND